MVSIIQYLQVPQTDWQTTASKPALLAQGLEIEACSVGATVSVLNVVTLGPAPRTYLLEFERPHPSICDSEVSFV